MTDNEIIKALECCKMPVGSGSCNNCPLKDIRNKRRIGDKSCTTISLEDALDLINRQKAEIEDLYKTLDYEIIELRAMRELANGLKAEVEFLKQDAMTPLVTKIGEAVERDEKIKAEAIKEFVERLCEDRVSNDPVVIAAKCLAKEMVGDNDA